MRPIPAREAIDAECSRINGEAPAGEHRRLLGWSLPRANLQGSAPRSPSIAKELKLPDFECSAKMAWPPPQPSLAAMFAMSMVPPNDPRYTADWAAALEKENARRAANEARRDKEEAERQAQSRLGYEASLRR